MSRLPECHALRVSHIAVTGNVCALAQLVVVFVAESDMKALWVLLTDTIDGRRGMKLRSCWFSASDSDNDLLFRHSMEHVDSAYRMKTARGYSCLSLAVWYAKATSCRIRSAVLGI